MAVEGFDNEAVVATGHFRVIFRVFPWAAVWQPCG